MKIKVQVTEGTTHSLFHQIEIVPAQMRKSEVDDSMRWKDVTSLIQEIVTASGLIRGQLIVQSLHTTTGFILNEAEDGLMCHDLPWILTRLVPKKPRRWLLWARRYVHDSLERLARLGPQEPVNATSHVRSKLGTQPTISLIVAQGKVVLGKWQSLLFVDLDAPHHEKCGIVISGFGTLAEYKNKSSMKNCNR